MKVGLLHYASPPVAGGVEAVIGRHARLFAGDGHEVSIVTGRGDVFDARVRVDVIPELDSRHPDVLAVKAELDRGDQSPTFDRLRERIAVALEAAVAGLDVLICHNVCGLHKNLALTAALHDRARSESKPALVAWHHDFAWLSAQYTGELHDGYPWDLLRQAWPGVAQVVISEYRARQFAQLAGIPESELAVVPNGIDIAGFLKLESRVAAFAARARLFDRDPVLLTPVRVTRRKNLQLALRTVAELRHVFPDACLLITGPLGAHNPANAVYLDELMEVRESLGLGDAVHFMAREFDDVLSDAEVSDCYRLADALLLPSEEEGFGLPVLEAAIAGIPAFVSDLPPLREIAGEQATYFEPTADARDVARLIARRLRDDDVLALRSKHRRSSSWEAIYRERILPVVTSAVSSVARR